MAKYRITGPDGGSYEISAPDGASEQDVLQYAMRSLGKGESEKPTAVPPAEKKPRSWTDVPGEALGNVPSSAINFAKGVAQPFLHPIDTGKAIFDTGYGLASKAAGALGMQQDPQEKAADEATADAIGQHFKDRFGSVDALKKTLATDPVGAMADASIALTGGGAAAARVPGAVGRAGQAARAVGTAIDPINATAKTVAATASKVPSAVLGTTTGVGQMPIEEAFRAGVSGNRAFIDNMRGNADINGVVDMAHAGVDSLVRDRGAAYRANMAATKADLTPLDIRPVRTALATASADIVHKGIVTDPTAAKVLGTMAEKYNEFARLSPAERTADTFDALKKSIGAVRETTQPGTNARRVADQVYNSVKSQIVKQSPSYADAMKSYGEASDQIGEMRRALSINEKAASDTTLRKLSSVMRNNVNTNYGARTKLVDELAKYQPDLKPAIAGQAMSSITPRGIAGPLAGAQALYNGVHLNPAGVAALPLASPRVVGEGAYALGRGVGMAGRGAAATGAAGTVAATLARYGYRGANLLRALGIDTSQEPTSPLVQAYLARQTIPQ